MRNSTGMRIKFSLGLVISAVFIFLAFRGIDYKLMLGALQHANYWWLLPSILAMFASHWLRAVRWRYFMEPIKRVDTPTLFAATMIGYYGNNVFPLRAGEVLRAYSIGKAAGVSRMASFATIIVERLIDIFSLLLLLALSVGFHDYPNWIEKGAWLLFFLTSAGTIFMVFLMQRTLQTLRLVERFTTPLPQRVREMVQKLLRSFLDGFGIFQKSEHFWTIAWQSVVIWLFYAATIYFTLEAFGLNDKFYLPLGASFIILVMISLGIMVPAAPGYVVEHLSWRWTFYMNLPVGLIAIVFISRFFHETGRVAVKQEIDYAGAAVLSLLAVGLLLGVTNIDLFSPAILATSLLAVIACLFLLIHLERKAASPIVPLHLLRRPEIAAANLTTLATVICAFALILFAPLFVQGVMMRSATQAGLVLLPFSFGWAGGSLGSGHLVNRFGYRTLAMLGAGLMITGFAYQVMVGMHAELLQVAAVCLIVGLGMGLATTAVTVSVQNSVPPRELGVATAATIFSRALGAAVGVSVLGAVLSQRVAHELRNVFPEAGVQAMAEVRALLLPESRAQIAPELAAQLQHGLSAGLRTVFLACLGIALLALFITLRVSAHKPVLETGTPVMEGGP